MASSCNRPQRRHDHAEDHDRPQQQQQKQQLHHPHAHQQHRFTSRSRMKQFHNSSLVIFVALALLISHQYVLCAEVDSDSITTEEHVVLSTIYSPQIDSNSHSNIGDMNHSDESEVEKLDDKGESTEPNERRNLTDTVQIDTNTTQQSISDHNPPQPQISIQLENEPNIADVQTTLPPPNEKDRKTISGLSVDLEQPDVNNDIFSTMLEMSPEVKISPDFINSQFGANTPESTENLEQSIRNSVKTEIEMEQGLEPSPVLEILKDIAEPDIRQTLTEDLIDPPILNQNDVPSKAKSDPEDDIEKEEDQTEAQPDIPIEVKEEPDVKELESNVENENAREARNLDVQITNESKNDTSESSSSSSSSESNSSENSQESNTGNSKVSLEDDNETELAGEQVTSKDEEVDIESNGLAEQQNVSGKVPEADLTIPKTSEEVHELITTPATDIAVFDDDESAKQSAEDEEALSVVLDESLSSTVPNDEDETLMNAEQTEQKTSLDIIAAEETTAIPEQSEHIVIKKVLDEQDIFETTVLPIEETESDSEKSSDVIVEIPNPTIIEEEIPDEKLNTHGDDSFVATQNIAEKVTNATDADEEKGNEEVITENQSEIQVNEAESPAMETIRSEKPHYEETNTESAKQTELHHEATARENIVEGAVHILSSRNGDEEPTVNQRNYNINPQTISSTTESTNELNPDIASDPSEEPVHEFNFVSTTAAAFDVEVASEDHDIVDEIPAEDVDYSKTIKGSRSVNTALIDDDAAATMFETYPPQDAGQTFNGNLADESAGIGKALPVSINDGSNRSTTIIILSSGTAVLFIVVSVAIFLISFQRQHGTLDIEMQERSCGKDNLDEEDAETFAKLLEVELPPSVAIALEETEECL